MKLKPISNELFTITLNQEAIESFIRAKGFYIALLETKFLISQRLEEAFNNVKVK